MKDLGVCVIAEVGVNHNGSLELARELVDAVAEAGANAVKFQTFRASSLVSRSAPKADYQRQATDRSESQLEMIRRLELADDAFVELAGYCRKRDIEFLSTPFDGASLSFLCRETGISRIKFSSGDLTNGPLLLQAAREKMPVILSTGMATLGEIEESLMVLSFGYVGEGNAPNAQTLRNAYASEKGQALLKEHVTILHCTTEYPAPLCSVNLRAMDTLARAFGLPVGYSDHTQGLAVPVAAAARGASIIEKHVTLDRNLPGPDHRASLEPAELAHMIAMIRDVEQALGASLKHLSEVEAKNVVAARKSLIAATSVRKGEPWNEENLTAKRPGCGISPMRYWDYLGRPAGRSYQSDELIEP